MLVKEQNQQTSWLEKNKEQAREQHEEEQRQEQKRREARRVAKADAKRSSAWRDAARCAQLLTSHSGSVCGLLARPSMTDEHGNTFLKSGRPSARPTVRRDTAERLVTSRKRLSFSRQ